MSKLTFPDLNAAARVLRALKNKLRQQILQYISDNGEVTVTQLYSSLRLEQSVASQHLAILRKENIVKTRRDGKMIYYSVDSNRINVINDLCARMIIVQTKRAVAVSNN